MSGEWTGERIRSALAQLTRQQPDLSQLDHAIMTAFVRLMQGRPELTDGAVTVTNICAEAGVSRASYYRSPVAPIIKTLLTTRTPPAPSSKSSALRSNGSAKPNGPCAASTPPNSAS